MLEEVLLQECRGPEAELLDLPHDDYTLWAALPEVLEILSQRTTTDQVRLRRSHWGRHEFTACRHFILAPAHPRWRLRIRLQFWGLLRFGGVACWLRIWICHSSKLCKAAL